MRIKLNLLFILLIVFAACHYHVYAQGNNISSLQQKGITNEVLWGKIVDIVVEKLNIDISMVTPEASFKNDLGADDLAMVEIVLRFEAEFDIQIPDKDVDTITTVGEAYNYIENRIK